MKRAFQSLSIALVLLFCGQATRAQQPAQTSDNKPTEDAPQGVPHTYRLTYTITETDGTRPLGSQHFAMTVNARAGDASLKLGSKVPVITGSYSTTASASQTQFTYLDVGLNIKAHLIEFPGGAQVFSKIEQSSVADKPSNLQGEPIIRQATLENTALLSLGKPVMLGSLDVPGSTRHLDIEVLLEVVH